MQSLKGAVILEHLRIYKISMPLIFGFMIMGIFLCLVFIMAIKQAPLVSILGLIFSIFTIGYSIYLWRKRKEGKGFYWDDEGIVIDLKGNKVYWDEIEDIKYSNVRGMKSTVIYPHYTNHEKIRIRRGKSLPTPAHSIDWILIEKAKEYHKNLMKVWEEKNNAQK